MILQNWKSVFSCGLIWLSMMLPAALCQADNLSIFLWNTNTYTNLQRLDSLKEKITIPAANSFLSTMMLRVTAKSYAEFDDATERVHAAANELGHLNSELITFNAKTAEINALEAKNKLLDVNSPQSRINRAQIRQLKRDIAELTRVPHVVEINRAYGIAELARDRISDVIDERFSILISFVQGLVDFSKGHVNTPSSKILNELIPFISTKMKQIRGLSRLFPDYLTSTSLKPPFVSGDVTNPDGTVSAAGTVPILHTGNGYALEFADQFGSAASGTGIPATFDIGGRLTGFTHLGSDFLYTGGSASNLSATDGTVAWGRWNSTSDFSGVPSDYSGNKGLHYVIGLPTPTMPTTGSFTFNLFGATNPTAVDGGVAPGTFTGSVNVNFATGNAALTMNIAMPGFTYNVAGQNVAFASNTFSATNITTVTAGAVPGAYCSVACKTGVEGAFYGAGATHLGLSYSVNDAGATKQSIIGAAAFNR